MKKLFLLLALSIGFIAVNAQYYNNSTTNPNPNLIAFNTLQEAINTPMQVGYKLYVNEKGVGGYFNVTTALGLTEDTIYLFDKHNGTFLARDTTQTGFLNVLWAGAKNDGIADNYHIFLRIAKYINKRGGYIKLYYPAGTYYIDSEKVAPTVVDTSYITHTIDSTTGDDTTITIIDTTTVVYDTVSNNFTDIILKGVQHVDIVGDGAIISINGNFTRRTTKRIGTRRVSNYNAICPFAFIDSKYITLSGFTVDGNNQQQRRSSDGGYLIEGDAYGLKIASCDYVQVWNCTFKNIQTDGVYIDVSSTHTGSMWHASTNVTMTNVYSLHSGRQAITLGSLNTATFTDCHFDGSGDSLGGGTAYPPQKGLDIEPVRFFGVNVDLATENIHFMGCTFKDNVGGTISSNIPSTCRNIFFTSCTFDNSKFNYNYGLINGIYNSVYDKCVFNMGTGAIYAAWGIGTLQKFKIENSVINSAGSGIVCGVTPQYGGIIDNNLFIGKHDTSFHNYFPYINARVIFKNNKIVLDSGLYSGVNGTKALVQFCDAVQNNTWLSSLDTTGGKRQYISYSSSVGVSGEKYSGAVVPFTGATWPFTTFPAYGTSDMSGGSRIVMDNGTGIPATISWGTGQPTSGFYYAGSMIFMRSPSTAGTNYYQCTTTGTAGVDAVFAKGPIVSSGASGGFTYGFVKDVLGNIAVGDSTRNLNSTFRQSGRESDIKGSIWTTGTVNDTGMIVFKSPMAFSASVHITIKGTIVNVGHTADYIVDFTPVSIGTFSQASLVIRGDSSLLTTKVRLIKDSISNYYVAFYDTTSVLADRTTISIDHMQLTGISAVFTNVGNTWAPALLTSLRGYTIGATLTNTAGANYNYVTNKPTIPAQFNPIAGNGVTITGSYPNNTFSQSVNLAVADIDADLKILSAMGSTIKGETFRIDRISTGTPIASLSMRFVSLWLPYDTTLTGVKWFQTAQGVFNANNENRIGLYTYNKSTGGLTLVASTANDTTTWKGTANTWQSRSFSSTYTAASGLYFVGFLYNSSAQTTAPSIGIAASTFNVAVQNVDLPSSGKMIGSLASQTTLPTTTNMSSLAATTAQYYMAIF